MTAERRLTKIERSLSPTELVLHWLEEAHRHDDVEAYGRAIYALGPGALPLERLIDDARHSAEIGCPHGSRERNDQAIRTAIRQTVFLFHLVFQTISLAQAALEREMLVHAALCAYLGLVLADDDMARRSVLPSRTEGLTGLRGTVVTRAVELRALEIARQRVETKYLGGHPTLFRATVRTWSEQREQTEGLAAVTLWLAEFESPAPMPADDPDRLEARVKAYDDLGEGRRAVSVAMAWLEPRLG